MTEHAVVLQGHLPLALGEWPVDAGARSALMADNLALLRALLVMDAPVVINEEEGHEGLSNLETKIDLLLLLVSAGIKGLGPLPPSYPCILGSRDLFWDCSDPGLCPDADAEACVALFLRPRIAMPLLLPGSMRPPSGVPASASGAIRCHLHFCLDSPVQESLDRLIFRHHRRAVARSRNQHYPLDE